ncbi:transketolase [Actinospica durhamensis]|uniref:Transketolase n=1 Tax=Actinospica durhamensis TaxID=1508375 RepID=A0A941IS82_9ACTN|nr:transketolase C-terminal domain-containing protein [Actinospica durhamensis]MBR7836097.1 transketolase [Actinospica durhamensis]
MSTPTVWDVVHHAAREDQRVVFIGSDLNPTILSGMRTELPGQFFMEGIQEQNVIGMAAGMALEGARPVVSTISTFLTRRCFEQILIDIALHELPVVLLGTGPGVAYHHFGPTHCAVDDLALLRTVPGLTLLSPKSMAEAAALTDQAVRAGVFAYLRVPRYEPAPIAADLEPPVLGRAVRIRDGHDATIVALGSLTPNALVAAEALAAEGLSVAVEHVHTVRPLDPDLIARVSQSPVVVTVEEHLRDGGLGTELLHHLADAACGTGRMPRFLRLGLETRFVSGYGTWEDAIAEAGLDTAGIATAVRTVTRPLEIPAADTAAVAAPATVAPATVALKGSPR